MPTCTTPADNGPEVRANRFMLAADRSHTMRIKGALNHMDANELGLRRIQMGHAAGAMLRGGPAPFVQTGEGY